MQCLRNPVEGIRIPPKLGLIGNCELPCWCWALTPQSSGIVARFLTTEPSLQSQTGFELAISLPLFQGVEIIGMHHHAQHWFFFFFFEGEGKSGTGIQNRSFCLLGKCSASESDPQWIILFWLFSLNYCNFCLLLMYKCDKLHLQISLYWSMLVSISRLNLPFHVLLSFIC